MRQPSGHAKRASYRLEKGDIFRWQVAGRQQVHNVKNVVHVFVSCEGAQNISLSHILTYFYFNVLFQLDVELWF